MESPTKKEIIQQLKTAIKTVKSTEPSFFKCDKNMYYLCFTDDGTDMWLGFDNPTKFCVALSHPAFGLNNTKKYVLEILRETLIDLL